MKQKIRVVGILKRGEGVLLLKKRLGQGKGPIFWSLPMGKMEFGEQPEEALGRVLTEKTGVKVEGMRLLDVVSFLGIEGGRTGAASERTAGLYIIYDIRFDEEKRIRLNERYSAYKFMREADFEEYLIEDASRMILGLEEEGKAAAKGATRNLGGGLEGARDGRVYRKGMVNGATVFVDGCSRGNPGPAGIGYYVVGGNGEVLRKGGEFIGFATSRVAEYYALKEGIEQAKELGLKEVCFVSDNLMLVNQMRGVYRIKNKDIEAIAGDILELLKEGFVAVEFRHVKRELNGEADREANLAVDRHFEG